jgi:hypothetical protein
MKRTLGFLASGTSFTADVPDRFGSSSESVTSVGIGGVGYKSVIRAPSDYKEQLIADAHLDRQHSREQDGVVVTSFGANNHATGALEHRVLIFEAAAGRRDFGIVWITFEEATDGPEMRDAVLKGLSPRVDDLGVPRLDLSGALRLAPPIQPINREMVSFMAHGGAGIVDAVRFTNAGAFATSDGLVRRGTSTFTVGTAGGVVVSCDGDQANEAQLSSEASAIADSVRMV